MIHEKHKTWLETRGIAPWIAERFGLTTTSDDGGHWLAIPYVERGQVLNHKYRRTQEKRHRMDAGAPLTWWNHDALLSERVQSGQASVIITEGEWDALAAYQSGFEHVVSVPNGSPKEPTRGEIDPENDAERFRFVWRSRDLLDKVGSFILAVDGDDVGRVLGGELARRLGPERCKFVSYPEGCKDLNDVLLAHGEAGVVRVLDGAKPYPVKGIYKFSDFPEPPPVRSIPLLLPGAEEGPELVPGTLTVWTGFAGAGKTSLMCFVVADLLKRGIAVAVGSFETQIKPILHTKMRAAIIGCSDKDVMNRRFVEQAQVDRAEQMLEDQFVIMCQDIADEEHELTLEEVLDMCRVAVVRDGVRLIIIDPWNELEHKRRPDESETDYTGRAIRALKHFARLYDVAIWIVAHPKKPMSWGQKPAAPGLYDISGSSHWANKADYGCVIHRPNKETNMVELIVCKVRMGLPGREQSLKLEYRWTDSSYVAASRGMEDA